MVDLFFWHAWLGVTGVATNGFEVGMKRFQMGASFNNLVRSVSFFVNSFWFLSLLNDIDGCLCVCASRLDGSAHGFLVVLTSLFIRFPLEVSVSTWPVEAYL